MKVLQINAVYGHGSTGTIVRDIEHLCWNSGIECYVASPDKNVLRAKRGYLVGNVFDYKLHAALSRIHGKQAYFSRISTKKLLRWMDEIKPDVVHLHNLHSNYIYLNGLLDYLALNNIRTIITFHDCWFFTGGCFHYTSSGCYKWLGNCDKCPRKNLDTPSFLGKHSARILEDRSRYINAIPNKIIIGASEWIANECKRSVLSKCDIRHIHNGFSIEIFHPTNSDFRKKYGLENKYVILAPASKWLLSVNKKTYDFFIEHMNDNMVLVLFGCKNFHDNLPDNVLEIGFISEPKTMAALYSMADVMVNCTREDTLPGINLECQATGTPVITYDSTGCKETVDGICGKAVPVGDYIKLFDAVLEFSKIGKNAMSNQCINWICNNFNLHDAYQKYIDLYAELMDK